MNVIIIGNGEIGQSIYKVLANPPTEVCQELVVDIRDIKSNITGHYDGMIIAIPYFSKEQFLDAVKEYEKLYTPDWCVIHSTVDVGTTQELGEKYVHAPVKGKHPNLQQDIQFNYPMHMSGNSEKILYKVADIYNGFLSKGVMIGESGLNTASTELAKIMSTTYYGWNILFAKEMERLCNEYNVSFHDVYRMWNTEYNDGMIKRGTPNFCRPVLDPKPGKIGGHCVIPNAELFKDKSYIAKLIVEKNKEYESEFDETSDNWD